ncbi:MAG TPA: branched-chain amino acid ABC transporter substrate-binding protein [Rhodopila sp.]|uniref:branched-chain amino acid ABC transporter substrate-binding protein n=1 Tax=Rhodopila sp. TaxID=2480087 RepID=UPI002CDE9BFC|nr:branched-chain amino acid ABC transporter substrate-binding protein [Rhodopila sp.]HVY14649.1 branched-chain amino acid ABC transporter substrate-binding protein [Rhodopila sp.]
MILRRAAARLIATTAITVALGATGLSPALAADKAVTIGADLSLTGADAQGATRVKDAIQMAIEGANQANAVPGYHIDMMVLDDGTATAGQYDPAQAATNARKMVSEKSVVGAIGPQMSGAGKAMAPILSQGDLATITPASTNPDITNPKYAAQYRPAGKPIYFRTVTTDAYQGPNMANFFAEKLNVKSVYVLDDSGAFGVGVADAFEAQAKKKGMNVMGRDRLDPKAADYSAVLTKIKQLNPDAIYYGGVSQAGVKLAKQAYDIVPKMIKGGPDGMTTPDLLNGAGFPAVEGWYTTIAAPHLANDPKAAQFVASYKGQFGMAPDDYSITAYDATLTMIDAIKRVAATGKPVTRQAVQAALMTSNVPTIQGVVSFDANGDLASHIVSVFHIEKDASKPLDDVSAQYKYVGVAPQS